MIENMGYGPLGQIDLQLGKMMLLVMNRNMEREQGPTIRTINYLDVEWSVHTTFAISGTLGIITTSKPSKQFYEIVVRLFPINEYTAVIYQKIAGNGY